MYMRNDKVSVVVPIYNAEKYIESCIKSILDQTYKRIELILVNDGSTDNSLQICKEKQKEDNRIVVVTQANAGVTKARSEGLNRATGEWVCFVDADDSLPTDSIQLLYDNSEGVEIVIGQVSHIGDYEWDYPRFNGEMGPMEAIEAMFHGKIHSGPVARLMRRELFDCKTFDIPRAITYGEDFIMNYEVFQKAKKIRIIDSVVYNYFFYGSSVSNKKNPYSSLSYCRLQEKLLKEKTFAENVDKIAPLLREKYWYNRKRVIKLSIKKFLRCLNLCK